MNFRLLAHAGEEHAEVVNESPLAMLGQLPTVVALLIVAAILTGLFFTLKLMKVNFVNRVMAVLVCTIALAVLFMQHNPLVSTTLLATGFGGVFLLVVTLLSAQRR